MIRVLVADDQAAVRGEFAALIDAQENLHLAGQASNGRQAVDLARPDALRAGASGFLLKDARPKSCSTRSK